MKEENRIIYHKYRFSGKEWIRYGAEGALIGLLVVWLTYQRKEALPLAAGLLVLFLVLKNRQRKEERRKRLQYHFRSFLSSLHTTMAAGYSLENAVKGTARDMSRLFGEADDLTQELKSMVRQMGYQRPVEQLFRELGERSGVEDIRDFGELLMITKRTGGNMDQVLASAGRTLCEKIDTEKEIDALTAAKRYEQKIMSLMPAGVILYLKVGFAGFLDPLYGSLSGVAIMTGCLLLYAAAFFLGRYLTRQEVL